MPLTRVLITYIAPRFFLFENKTYITQQTDRQRSVKPNKLRGPERDGIEKST
jgi:hypothetical protein